MPKTKKTQKSGFATVLDALKTNVMRVSSKNVADDIDSALSRISGSIIDKNSTNYADMMKSTMSDILNQKFDFKDLSRDFFQSYTNTDRFNRYANAEEITDSVPYCSRALKVLADEIVAPDDINKTIIQILHEESETDNGKQELDNIHKLNKILGIEDYLHSIIYDTLKFGDQFIELCDYTDDDVPISQSLLTEGKVKSTEPIQHDEITIEYNDIVNENGTAVKDKRNISIKPIVVEAKAKNIPNKPKASEKIADIQNVRLIIHDPRYIIKLQSQRFKMCLGYIVMPRFQLGMNSGGQQASQLKSMIYGMNDYGDMTGIDKLYIQIMKTVKTHLNDKEFNVNKKEVETMLARCVKEFDETNNQTEFKVRFVAPEKIEHFTISNRRFFPYGEGLFYKTTFAAKMLIALETATTIKRITDSTDTRVFYVETGVPRNARDVIDEIREARTKKKISLDSMGSIGSIPSMINSYEDYYVPQTNGKRYIEFDSVAPAVNVRDATEELKFMRDNLVASLEVPPSYIGLEENLSNKAALSFENILFARTVVAYQKGLSKHLWGLFNKLYKFIYEHNLSKDVNITFPPPKMLQTERESEHMRMTSELIQTLTDLGIDKDYLKKKYLSIDWDELRAFETQSNLKDKLEPDDSDDMAGTGGAGGFGGF